LAPGAAIECGGRRYVITHILSLEAILAKDQETGRSLELKLCDITPPTQLSVPDNIATKDLALIEQQDWTTAELWFSRIYPLLSGRRTDEMVRAVAQEAGVHRTTVYRKLARYEQTSRVSELTPTKPTGGKGQSRLAPEAEAIVDSLLKEVYLNRQKRSIKKTADEIRRSFAHAGLKPPHYNTIRNRILAISERKGTKSGWGRRLRAKSMTPSPVIFPVPTGRSRWSRLTIQSSTSC
jgi:putative transposase